MGDNQDTQRAIEEGRRIYVGSLRYVAKPEDVEELLQAHGFSHDKIHMSIDPISARNPGYCFVELPTAEDAARALTELNGQSVLGRPVKTGPCEAKASTPRYKSYERNRHQDAEPTFKRWGDWRGGSAGQAADGGAYLGGKEHQSQEHIDQHAASNDGRRLFVSGLPKMLNQLENDAEMRELFTGFDITAVGKRVIPYRYRNSSDLGDNFHHCFVDMATKEQANEAVRALDGKSFKSNGPLKVTVAKPHSGAQRSRQGEGEQSSSPRPRSDNKDRSGMASASWRRAG